MILFSSSSSQRERSPLLSLSFLFCLLHLFASANGALKNITADDEEGDPAGSSKITYLPSNDSWIQGKTLPDYGGLDISKVWATTWHNASTTGDVFPSISVTFEGTAAYVYCVVQRSEFWTNLTMYLDGVKSETYQNNLFNPNDPIYSELVYYVEDIEDTQHTLLVTMDDPRSSYDPYNLMLFDRFVYTTNTSANDPSSSNSSTTASASASGAATSPSKSNSDQATSGGSNSGLSAGGEAAIAISVIASVVLGVGAAVFLHRRRKRREQADPSYMSVPGNAEGGTGGSNSHSDVPSSESTGRIETGQSGSGSGSHNHNTNMQSINTTIPSNYAFSLHPTQYDPIPTYREPTRYTGLPEA